jgi:hypothetical protein
MKNRKKIIILGVMGIVFSYLFFLHTANDVLAQGEEGGIGQMQGNPGYDYTSGTMKTAEEKTKELNQMYPSSSTTNPTGAPSTGGAYRNQEKIPGFGQTSSFPDYLKQIVNFGFAAIGIMAMFMLMIGAYQYLMAAGNIAKEESAKTTISSAFAGLVLGLVAFLLLRTINPDLVSFNLAVLQGGPTGGGVATSPSQNAPVGGAASPSDMSKVNCDAVRNYNGFMNKNSSDLYNENVKSAQDLQNDLTSFRKSNNGLTQYSDTIYQACKDNNVPYWYAIGTFAKESSMFSEGNSGCSQYNNPGCMKQKNGQYMSFATPEEGIQKNIENMGRRISENPTAIGAWNKWYWPDGPGNCAGAQEYLDIMSKAAGATGLSGL